MLKLQNLLKLSSVINKNLRPFSGGLVTHRNTSDNNESTHFEFTPENWILADEILAKYPSNYKKSACIPLLMLAQEQENHF